MKYTIYILIFFAYQTMACNESKENYPRFVEDVKFSQRSNSCTDVTILLKEKYFDKNLYINSIYLSIKNQNDLIAGITPHINNEGDGFRSVSFCLNENFFKESVVQFGFGKKGKVELSKTGAVSRSMSLCGLEEEVSVEKLINVYNKKKSN